MTINNKFNSTINSLDRSTRKYLKDSDDRTANNKMMTRYYFKYAREKNNPVLFNKAYNLQNCFKYVVNDTYEEQKIKAIVKTNLCHDKFCSNCLKHQQDSRIIKYMPKLRELSKEYSLYHMIITQPNCNDDILENDLEKQSKCFKRLNEFLNCKIPVKALDFSVYGYKGCIKCLEITYKSNPKHPECYHPHLHCAVLFDLDDEDVLEHKQHENKYSYDKNNPEKITLFSDLEILIQRLWYLIWNDIPVTKKNIDSCKDKKIYSVMINRFENGPGEVFKYIVKFTDEKKKKLMKYEHFIVLYEALYRKKQLQAYGVLYNQKNSVDVTNSEIDKHVKDEYQEIIDYLDEIESPVRRTDPTKDLLRKDSPYKVISRRKRHLKRISVLE